MSRKAQLTASSVVSNGYGRESLIKFQRLAEKYGRELMRAIGSRDFRPVLDLFAPDVLFESPQGKSQGREEVLVHLNSLPAQGLSLVIESSYPSMVSILVKQLDTQKPAKYLERMVLYMAPDGKKFVELRIHQPDAAVYWGG